MTVSGGASGGQRRRPEGSPASTGGQFDTVQRPDAGQLDVEAGRADERSLRNFRLVGFYRNTIRHADGTSQPGGVCGNCGRGIANCVTVEHLQTGDRMDVGMDCAQQVGLDRDGLRALRQEHYGAERDERAAARRAERAAKEAARDAEHGEHGTGRRYESGCRCGDCRQMAPHGTVDRLEAGDCTCEPCVAAAVETGVYEVDARTVLVDLETGRVLDARSVGTRYGYRWVVDRDDGSSDWYPYAPKRRSTLASKGVMEATVDTLFRKSRSSGGRFPIARLTDPDVDRWGETLPTPPGP